MGLDGLDDTEGCTTTIVESQQQNEDEDSSFHWTAATALQALALMVLAGFAESTLVWPGCRRIHFVLLHHTAVRSLPYFFLFLSLHSSWWGVDGVPRRES